MSLALYRKYRSHSLAEIVGQKHITDILGNAIKSKRISHAYLLTGPRGVGKTSIARIMAYTINNLEYVDEAGHVDIIEIDAASNNGVEDIRDLREKVQIAPFSASKKIYIIDEVHMLSKSAFNALLKTLEEPPEHVVFILATTNVEKIPDTIISRTQRFTFRPIGKDAVVSHLKDIADKESIKITDEALELIADRGEGSFRDSISLLDQLSGLTSDKITPELIENVLGLAPKATIKKLVEAVENGDLKSLVEIINKTDAEGIDSATLSSQLINLIRTIAIEKPQLLEIMEDLIDVERSPKPKLKLLSILGKAAMQKKHPKVSPLLVATKEISADVIEIKQKYSLKEPKPTPVKPTVANTDNPSVFKWNNLVEYMKQNHVAIYSVLIKCKSITDTRGLTIYTNSKFYAKKLEDTKYRLILQDYLNQNGLGNMEITISPSSAPSNNSHVNAIADIMGGGEEISIEEV